MTVNKRFKKLARIVSAHEKRLEKFQDEAAKPFNKRGEELLKVIQKYVPGVTGCLLFHRRLMLFPMELQIPITRLKDENMDEDEKGTERLNNILDYLDDDRYSIDIDERAIEALRELDELTNYVDDNYSGVSGFQAGTISEEF